MWRRLQAWTGSPPGWVYVTVLLLGLLVGYGVALWRLGSPADLPPGLTAHPAPTTDVQQVVEEPAVNLPTVTRPDTVLRYESYHQPCGLLISKVELAGRDLAGLTQGALAQQLSPWEIRHFGENEVVARRHTDEPCPDTGAPFTLGLADERVVVYRGREAGGEIYAETGLTVADLLPGDRQVLAAGVSLVGERQIWQYLEGLAGGEEP